MRKILLLLVMIGLLSITFFTGAAMINLKAETIDTVFFITTTPSEDTSTEMNVNWHCKFSTSYLELTLASDTKFENAIKVTPTEKRWSTKGLENENPDDGFYQTRYVCSATLKDLSPRTRYIYRIKFDTYTSDVHSFTTSGLTNDWTFMAIADLQNANNSVVHSFISKLYQACDYPSLVVCSGDLTDTGGDQSQWLWSINNKVFNDFIFATSPGDHEYHASKVASPVPMFNAPHGFNSIFNNPKNGAADVQNSNYYFYYNNVLFVALDMCDSNSVSGSRFTAQENWFKETIEKLKGTYQYLVVYDHKSLYGSQDTDSSVRKKLTARWYPIFDQFNVDVVFSGHDHQYSRTYQLYNNAVSTDELVGTYYADLCCAGNKFRTPSADLTSDGLHECVLDLKETKTPVGARVDVTEEKMVITVIDSNNKTVDSFEIKAKREAKKTDLSGFDANAFVNEMQIDVYNSANVVKTGKLTFNSYQNLKYVKVIEILNKDDQEVCSTNISYNNVNGYSLTNLNSVEYKVKVTLLFSSLLVIVP